MLGTSCATGSRTKTPAPGSARVPLKRTSLLVLRVPRPSMLGEEATTCKGSVAKTRSTAVAAKMSWMAAWIATPYMARVVRTP